jgi:hypothetical protein
LDEGRGRDFPVEGPECSAANAFMVTCIPLVWQGITTGLIMHLQLRHQKAWGLSRREAVSGVDPKLIGLAELSGKASVWGFGSKTSPHHNFMEMNRFFLDCRLGRDDDLMRLQSRLSLRDAISDVRQARPLSAIVCDHLRKSAASFRGL